jgi:bifunctional non-homologous end joining protein LigD
VPPGIKRFDIREKSGRTRGYLVVKSVAGLVASAQIGALELHLWGSRTDCIEKPERIVFDLDPDEGLEFAEVRAAAFEFRDVFRAADLKSFAMLTGGKGIHVIVPVRRTRNWTDIKAFAKGLAAKMVAASPSRYVDTAAIAKRKNRIFIDWLRNERGATAIAPYSLRARAGAPIATPVSWRELTSIDSAARFTLGNIGQRLSKRRSDPWPQYHASRQAIGKAHLAAVE